ncbi:hypothetical protein TNCV_4061881 [Trichonephila clavipes]|nr:hypothetical protein TNCV_4061881 [Trichonephila clavipes]
MVGKRLRSALSGVIHKIIGVKRPALPQSFQLSTTADEYGTVLRTLCCQAAEFSGSGSISFGWILRGPRSHSTASFNPTVHNIDVETSTQELDNVVRNI